MKDTAQQVHMQHSAQAQAIISRYVLCALQRYWALGLQILFLDSRFFLFFPILH